MRKSLDSAEGVEDVEDALEGSVPGMVQDQRLDHAREDAEDETRSDGKEADGEEQPGTDGDSTDDEGTASMPGVVKDEGRAAANEQHGTGGRRAAVRRNAVPQIVVGENFAGPTVLLLATRSGRQAMDSAARAWTTRYREDRMGAVGEVVTYMLQMSGVVAMAINGDEVASEGVEGMKERIEACAVEKGLEGIVTGRGGKVMKDNYKELWDRMIRELGKGEGIDFAVVETVTHLATALSTSKVREVRKMAVVTVAQVSKSLLYVAAEKHQGREGLLAQAENAKNATNKRRKGPDVPTSATAGAFMAQADACTRVIQEILTFTDSIFQTVFTTRFRDVDAEIRATVVSSLGSWMGLYPWSFLNSTYLKYLGWALSDKDGVVRYAAVVAVRDIYGKDENELQLNDFTNRFADRMEELMEDKEDYVAVVGTELVTLLVQKNHLGSERGRNVFNLLSDPSERLRLAAADLAAGMIKKIGKDAVEASGVDPKEWCAAGAEASGSARRGKTAKGSKKKSSSASFSSHEYEIAGVLSTLRSLAVARGHPGDPLPEQIVHFVISSLSHKLESLNDWSLMVDWMKREVPGQLFASLGAADVAMRDMSMSFLCAVKSAVTLPQSRSNQTKERKKLLTKAKQEVTLLLQTELQTLINKFGQSDPTMATTLVRLIPLMMVDLYTLKKEEAGFAKLLQVIIDVMFRHADHECVLACSRVLAWCTSMGKVNTKDIARSFFSKVETQALNDLGEAVKLLDGLSMDGAGSTAACDGSDAVEESQDIFTIKSALTHVSCILETQPSSFGASKDVVKGSLRGVLSMAAEGVRLPSKVVFDAWRSLFLMVIYDVSLIDKESTYSDEDAAFLSNIKDAVSDLSCALQATIGTAVARGWSDVAAMAASGMADLFTVFNSETLPVPLKELGYSPLDEDIDVFWNGMEAAICNPELLGGLDAGDGQPSPNAVDLAIRVCCSLGIRQYKQLGAKLLSYWENPRAPADFSGAFRELLKKLKAIDGNCLTDVYMGAMRLCYQRYCEEVYMYPEAERAEKAVNAIEPFLLLSHKIANSQAALNATSTLAAIAEKAALWALGETPKNLEFLQGASYFVIKVKGGDAASILDKLVSAGLKAGAPADTGDDLGDWELFYEYCDVLKAQVQKSNGGVLKKSTPKSAGGNNQKRRISFAMADEGDFEAKVTDMNSRERRRSRRESGAHNYRETQTDEVVAGDSDIVEF